MKLSRHRESTFLSKAFSSYTLSDWYNFINFEALIQKWHVEGEKKVAGVLNNLQYHFGPVKKWLLHFSSKPKHSGVSKTSTHPWAV